jgi:CRISPR-associated protein Cas2
MMVLVTYDVETQSSDSAKRLRKIAKTCLDYGQRVQYSVFECEVDPAQWETFKNKLFRIYDTKKDSLRFYFLGSNWKRRVEHHGAKVSIDLDKPLII